LLGDALTTAGLYIYLKGPRNNRLLVLSALAFCLGGFTKQTLVAFPAAVGLDLLFKSRRKFAVWSAAMVAVAGILFAATMWADGHYLLSHLFLKRAYSWRYAWNNNLHIYLSRMQIVLLFAALWSILAWRRQKLLVSAFLLSHFVAFLLAGGYGVALNIFFNAFAGAVIICGVGLAHIKNELIQLDVGSLHVGLCGALMLGLVLGLSLEIPSRIRESYKDLTSLHSNEAEFQSATQLLRSRPGSALCENLLLCYEAGKPYEFDVYQVSSELKDGSLDPQRVLNLIESRRFQTVEVDLDPEEANQPLESLVASRIHSDSPNLAFEDYFFTNKFMEEVSQDYRVVRRNSHMLILEPK